MKVTIAFSDELHRRVKVHPAASGRQVRDIVEEALAAWLDRVAEAEDVEASRAALAECRLRGATLRPARCDPGARGRPSPLERARAGRC